MTFRKIAAALALFGMAAAAAHATDTAAPAALSPEASSAGDAPSARRAVRDAATGKMRAPTAEEFEAMRASERSARAARGLPDTGARKSPVRVVQHASGMRSAVLGPEYLVTLRGQRQKDGSIRQSHAHGDHEHPVLRDARPTE